jgi:hypothetical protein
VRASVNAREERHLFSSANVSGANPDFFAAGFMSASLRHFVAAYRAVACNDL